MSTPATNERLLTYVDALREAVAQEMKLDPRVFVFGLDVDDRGLPAVVHRTDDRSRAGRRDLDA